ncbi:MAG TPA: YCF48-related protein [Thermoanaerobaculia bacterium]|jgi:photosystem II stability/assembly factor-like uncharacterized protein|nr:YCF48-related protein [Thermoanaerobaculia bacterium]
MRAKHVLPILLLLAAPLAAQVNSAPGEWRSLGPDGGEIFDLAVAPSNPRVVYILSQTVYRSLNGGATWAYRSDQPYLGQLTVDAANPSLVYATDGDVYRSLDGGVTWVSLYPGPASGVRQVVAHPRIANTLFAVTVEGLFQSADAGLHWKAVRGGLPEDLSGEMMVIDPVSPRRMYLVMEDNSSGKVLFKSLDGGLSWQPIDDSFISGGYVTAFLTDPRSPRTLYAAVGDVVYKSTDGGAAWKAAGTGLEGSVLALLIPHDRPGSVYAGTDKGLFLSLDGGATWLRQPLGKSPPGSVSHLVASGQALLALVEGTGQRMGVYRSRDGGRSWDFSSRGLHLTDVTDVDFGAPGTIWCVADWNLFRSTDDGLAWRRIQPDPVRSHVPVQVAVDPTDRSNVFVVGSDKTFWRSGDAGATWEAAGNAGLKVYDLAVDPQTPSTLYASGAQGISKSTDRGDTWTLLSAEPALYYEIHIAPSSPSTLYAVGEVGDFQWLLVRSTDAGATWTRMDFEGKGILEPSLAVDPLAAATVYATDRGYIYRSTDGGNTWSQTGKPLDGSFVYPLAISGTGRLYAASWSGAVLLYTYPDGNPYGDPLGDRYFFSTFSSLAPDPHDPCRIFAGPSGLGLYVFRHTGIPGCQGEP